MSDPLSIDVTILMPCLNEAETLGRCIEKALTGLANSGVTGEILIADNGSTDNSVELAERLGARVVPVSAKGYGSALRGGIEAARGKWIVMGDADDSYDFSAISPFVEKLRTGVDLVMGCRMPRGGGTIKPGAMPWKHRWIGNPILSAIGRSFFKCPVQDFHCGLRAFSKDAIGRLNLRTTGMEFASEMVISATLKRLKMAEVPITLHKDGRSRPPHLRSWRDGWRHLRFMLLYSPRWLFLYPGLLLMFIGGAAGIWLYPGSRTLGGVTFDIHTLLYAMVAILLGFQSVIFAIFTKVFAMSEGLLPQDARVERLFRVITLEVGLVAGIALLILGFTGSICAVNAWHTAMFGPLQPAVTLRTILPSVLALMLGAQTVFSSFFLSVLGLRRR